MFPIRWCNSLCLALISSSSFFVPYCTIYFPSLFLGFNFTSTSYFDFSLSHLYRFHLFLHTHPFFFFNHIINFVTVSCSSTFSHFFTLIIFFLASCSLLLISSSFVSFLHVFFHLLFLYLLFLFYFFVPRVHGGVAPCLRS